jgi:hypothetical protein
MLCFLRAKDYTMSREKHLLPDALTILVRLLLRATFSPGLTVRHGLLGAGGAGRS